MEQIAELARKRIQRARDQIEKCFAIHYTCGFWGDTPKEPATITFVVVKHLGDGFIKTFGDDYGKERDRLDQYSEYVQQHRNHIWVNWNMRSSHYGFEAIERRHKHLKGTPSIVAPDNRLDLSQAIEAIYGRDYVSHPRMESLARVNGVTSTDWLDKDASAAAYENGDFEKLLSSLYRKVEWIEAFFRHAVAGTLKTGVIGHDQENRPAVPLPLTDNEQQVLQILKDLPDGKGLTGKQIVNRLKQKKFPIEQSTLTRHIIPKLKQWHGVENRKGVGYFIAPHQSNPLKS